MNRWSVLLLVLALLCASVVIAGEVYRWRDEHGGVHYGSRPVGDATLLFRTEERKPASVDSRRETVVVSRVVDGDTVLLANGHRVRLVGINAPEVAVAGKAGQSGGQDARSRLAELVGDKRPLQFERAVEPVDRYGRLLGHLFDPGVGDVAAVMLKEGLVFALPYPPNVKYADAYMLAEAPARDGQQGLWAMPEYQVIEPSALVDAGNLFRRVRMQVTTMSRDGKDEILRDRGGFEARIPREAVSGFPALSGLLGKTLVVRGFVRSRVGRPYLPLVHPSQIEPDSTAGE
ncbi:MAG: thermonuclease family protein [Gammaproteobacteria bacterium]|nr:thermonuclease family protein [Gammaproteobacteria bacterium]